jgi:hypothetical protein
LFIPQAIDQRHTGFSRAGLQIEEQNPVSHTGRALGLHRLANQLRDYLPHGGLVLLRELPGNLHQVIVDFQSCSHGYYDSASDITFSDGRWQAERNWRVGNPPQATSLPHEVH